MVRELGLARERPCRERDVDARGRTEWDYQPWWGGFMSPPYRPVDETEADHVSAWYARFGAGYEMGTWYTVIAGLLNILVIYDAYGGPLAVPISGRKKDGSEEKDDENEDEDDKKNQPQDAEAAGILDAGLDIEIEQPQQ